jgi:hypothetical protein
VTDHVRCLSFLAPPFPWPRYKQALCLLLFMYDANHGISRKSAKQRVSSLKRGQSNALEQDRGVTNVNTNDSAVGRDAVRGNGPPHASMPGDAAEHGRSSEPPQQPPMANGVGIYTRLNSATCKGTDARTAVCFHGGTFASVDVGNATECCSKCLASDRCTHWTFNPDPLDGRPNCRLKKNSNGPPQWEQGQQCDSTHIVSGRVVNATRDILDGLITVAGDETSTQLDAAINPTQQLDIRDTRVAKNISERKLLLRAACTPPPEWQPPVNGKDGHPESVSSQPPFARHGNTYGLLPSIDTALCDELRWISQIDKLMRISPNDLSSPRRGRKAYEREVYLANNVRAPRGTMWDYSYPDDIKSLAVHTNESKDHGAEHPSIFLNKVRIKAHCQSV